MLKPMRLHVALDKEDAEIFQRNRDNQTFTPQQLARFERARQVYKAHLHEF